MSRKIGNLTPLALHILVALSQGSRHGYAIIQDIEERTGGAANLRSGTLYVALQRLADGGLIEEVDAPADSSDTRRKFFRLTDDGRRAALRDVEVLGTLIRDAKQRFGVAQ